MSQDQDFSSWLVESAPNVDILSYFPNRQLYWIGGPNKPPFYNRPAQPVNAQLLSNSIRKSESHCKLFDMSKDSDRILFQIIKNRVLQGWYRVAKENTNWDADEKKMLIWLEWVQDYLMYPFDDKESHDK